MKIKNILIVGAGIAGLTLLAALKKYNIKVDVVEKGAPSDTNGVAICLPANATACLKKLTILDAILAKSFVVKKWGIYTDQNRFLNVMDSRKFKQKTPFISVKRDELHQILLNLCNKDKILYHTQVSEINTSNNKNYVQLSSGEKKVYDLVVGADGIYSSVRNIIFPEIKVKQMGALCWRGIFKKPEFLSRPEFYLGDNEFILMHPVSASEVYCGAIAKKNEPSDLAANKFSEIYANFNFPSKRAISDDLLDVKLLKREIETVSEICWGSEHVILIGDAAHACAPAMQQGGSQALEDALILADLIGSGLDKRLIFGEFIKQRNERVSWVYDNSNLATNNMIITSLSSITSRNDLIKSQGLGNFNLWSSLFVTNPY